MTAPVVFDKSPVDVTGGLRVRRSRVIWSGGRLLVATGKKTVVTYDAPTPPVSTITGRWTITLPDHGKVNLTKRGCPCGYSLSKVPVTDILHAAGVGV